MPNIKRAKLGFNDHAHVCIESRTCMRVKRERSNSDTVQWAHSIECERIQSIGGYLKGISPTHVSGMSV